VRVKSAVTAAAAVILTVHVPVPAQPPPLQPEKIEPVFAVAVRVTDVPYANEAVQVEPQLIPEGELVIVPAPVPALLTVKVWLLGALNVAVTDLAAVIEIIQAPMPEQEPDQPAKVCPEVGVAVRVTDVPWANEAEQVEPQ